LPLTSTHSRPQLEKLLANPDKEVKLPAGMAERIGGVRAPKEIIKSVAGSASAAGSGEFHVYKHSRRREAERIRHMEETNRAVSQVKPETYHRYRRSKSMSELPKFRV